MCSLSHLIHTKLNYQGKYYNTHFAKSEQEDTWQTHSAGHATLDLGIVSLNPMLGVEIT